MKHARIMVLAVLLAAMLLSACGQTALPVEAEPAGSIQSEAAAPNTTAVTPEAVPQDPGSVPLPGS